VFFYLTVMNENYEHPPMPEGVEDGIVKGMYLLRDGKKKKGKRHHVQLMGSGTILREVIAAAELLEKDFDVSADVWSVTSFTELRREALDVERWNMLHPLETPRIPYVTAALRERGDGLFVASTDYMKLFPDQIRPFVPGTFRVLGTDGFGRSDYRKMLRSHFEVDRHFIALATIKGLADENKVPSTTVASAIEKYGIDPEKPNPART
jgi:pyruvate dehydrogenase E1 component